MNEVAKIENKAKKPEYTKLNFKNKKYAKFFQLCKKDQDELKSYLYGFLERFDYQVNDRPGFLFAKGDSDICLIAHMDTVHKDKPTVFEERVENDKHYLHSPQGIGGDDRCGVYIITRLIVEGFRPSILFTEDEEIGCVGAQKFSASVFCKELEDCKFLVQLDRRGDNDAVYYDLDNVDFENYITELTGYKTADGSCSDISEIAPSCGVAAVNLSSGYYHEHTLSEDVCWEDMLKTMEAVRTILSTEHEEQFVYKEYKRYNNWGGYGYYSYNRGRDYGWYDDDEITFDRIEKERKTEYSIIARTWKGYIQCEIEADSEAEAVGLFLMKYSDMTYEDIEEIS